jgi:hypothetical protein
MSWVVASVVGGGTAILKAVQANQTKEKNKGYISQADREAQQKMNVSQAYAREGGAESANARGLAQGGAVTANPITTAIDANGMVKATGTPTTIGGQDQSNMGTQMGLEQRDLTNQYTRAMHENQDTYNESLINAGVGGVETAIGVRNASGDKQAGDQATLAGKVAAGVTANMNAPTPSVAPPTATLSSPDVSSSASENPIHTEMLNKFSAFGVNPTSPLSSGAWSTRPPKLASPGQSAASFTAD